jgi:hypothetical protein
MRETRAVTTVQVLGEAVEGLCSDHVLIVDGGVIRFRHDVLEDWALSRLMASERHALPEFLDGCGEPLVLVHPLRLLALRALELNSDPSEWSDLLGKVSPEHGLSARWYQTVLSAPFHSPLLDGILPMIWPLLVADEGTLLEELLRTVRTTCTVPDPMVSVILGDLPKHELEKHIAHGRLPDVKLWVPVIQTVIEHKGDLPMRCMGEFAELAYAWAKMEDAPQRDALGRFCLEALGQEDQDAPVVLGSGKGSTEESRSWPEMLSSSVERMLKKSLLWVADVLPREVERFVATLLSKRDEDLAAMLLSSAQDWIPLCIHLPKVFVDAVEELMCVPVPAEAGRDWNGFVFHSGIRNDHRLGTIPTCLTGPFIGCLRFDAERGLDLIHRIVNHATRYWVAHQRTEGGRSPVPQYLNVNGVSLEIWGNQDVYCWFRYPNTTTVGVTSALMALEHWLIGQIEGGSDASELIQLILRGTCSAAVVGVCVSAALATWKASAEAAMPVLENPAFWQMDRRRAILDQTSSAEAMVDAFGFDLSRGEREMAKKSARAPHRRLAIDVLAQALLLADSSGSRERLRARMAEFPLSPPYFFKDELTHSKLMERRTLECELIAAQAEMRNYELAWREDLDAHVLVFKPPAHLEAKQAARRSQLEVVDQIYRLMAWGMAPLHEGKIGSGLSREDAALLARELA